MGTQLGNPVGGVLKPRSTILASILCRSSLFLLLPLPIPCCPHPPSYCKTRAALGVSGGGWGRDGTVLGVAGWVGVLAGLGGCAAGLSPGGLRGLD
jgi:hypothetical protein